MRFVFREARRKRDEGARLVLVEADFVNEDEVVAVVGEMVTDGEIWDQQRLFDLLNEEIGVKEAPIRVFTLGVGDAFSSSLIEGVARAGNGFSQAVGENEKLDGKVVRNCIFIIIY